MKKLAQDWKIIIVVIILITCLSYYTESAIYKCTICEMSFEDKKWADKCQHWCESLDSCNAEITKHAIKKFI